MATSAPSIASCGIEWRCRGNAAERRRRRIGSRMIGGRQAADGGSRDRTPGLPAREANRLAMPEPGSARPDARFWSGRRVLITGHTGFKGAWLSLWLAELGAQRVGLRARRPDRPVALRAGPRRRARRARRRRHPRRASASPRRSPDCDRRSCCTSPPSRSCAARSATRVETYATNVMGTVNVLDAVRRAGDDVRVAVVVSSDKCYENREWRLGLPRDRADGRPRPVLELEGLRRARHRGLPRLVLRRRRRARRRQRPRRQRHRRRRLGRGPPAARRLSRRPGRRPDPHPQPRVRAPVAARAQPAERLPAPGRARLGGPRRWPRAGTSAPPTATPGPCAGSSSASSRCGTRRCAGRSTPARIRTRRSWLKLDSSLARARLDWTPGWDLAAGLERTVAWYRDYRDGADVREATLGQVRAFAGDG